MASSNIKMLGMYSGWDTESIISQMMKISQLRIDSKTRSRIALQWKQESLNNIKTELTDFRRTYLTALGASALRVSSAFNSTVAKISGTNAGAVSIKTSINSAVGTMKIGQVYSLAKNASVTTLGSASRDGAGFKLTDTLGSLLMNTGDVADNARTHVNGATITFSYSDSLDDINAKIKAGGGNAILFDKVDYQGRAYAQISVNGKSVTYYAEKAITAEQIVNSIGADVTFDTNTGFANVTLLGQNIQIWKNETLESINNKLDPGGANNPANIDQSKRISWYKDSVDGRVKAYVNFVGDGDGTITTSAPMAGVTAGYISDNKLSTAISFDSSGEATVTINGESVTINKNFTIEDINGEFINHANDIKWLTGADGVARATFTIDAGSGPETVTLSATDSGGDVGMGTLGGSIAQEANRTITTTIDKDGTKVTTSVYDRGIKWDTRYLSDGTKYATANIWIKTSNINSDPGVSIQINQDMTIQEMINKVNSSGAGVTMRYDRLSDQFVIENDRPDTPLQVGGLEAFGIFSTNVQAGSRAMVRINDELVTQNSNTFDYRGVTITLNETTQGSGAGGAWRDEDNITVSLTRDATDAIERVRAFVDSYNTIVSKLESLLSETKNRSERTYLALTDEEKQNMTEKQIEEWETIAKKGMLKNDSGIQSLINSLRGSLFETISSVGLTPHAIGLSTGRYDAGTGSQIVLDEDKLRAALEEDPEKIANLFMGISESGQDRGWLWRVDDLISSYVDGSQYRSISNLETSIRRANEEIEKLQDKMFEEEDKLYKRFAAMETALSKLQSQLDWFNAMMGTSNTK